jgi:asparagine synthase (glutamine-hydrolysing)
VLAKGRFVRLSRELRALRVDANRIRYIFNWAIQPLLPDSLLSFAAWIRGRPLRGYFERPIPRWIRNDFATSNQIRERTRAGSPRTRRGSRAAHEMYWYLTEPLYPRLNALIAGYALEEGIEIRSPFYDKRVIEFAASRPPAERSSLGERKRLLRQAMRGLLPDDVLTPRAVKPGTLAGYFEKSMRAAAPLLEQTLEKSLLAELGVVDLPALQRSLGLYMQGRETAYVREQLYFVVQTELWLRANLPRPATMESEIQELVWLAASEKGVTTV